MQMRNSIVVTCAVLGLQLTACGHEKSRGHDNRLPPAGPTDEGNLPEPSIPPGPDTPSIGSSVTQGTWDGPCLASKVNKDLYDVQAYTFASGTMRRWRRIFLDQTCQTLAAVETLGGTYQFSTPNRPANIAEKTTILVNIMIMKTESDAGANAFNASKVCGLTDWHKGTERSTMGVQCLGYTYSENDLITEIIAVDGDKLMVGERLANSQGVYDFKTEPTKLDSKIVYVRR